MKSLPLILVIVLSSGILLWNFSFYEVHAKGPGTAQIPTGLFSSRAPSVPGVIVAPEPDLETVQARLAERGKLRSVEANSPQSDLTAHRAGGRASEVPAGQSNSAERAPRRRGKAWRRNQPHPENGPWREYWRSGNPRTAGQFKEGKREGHWVQWFEGGQLQAEGDFVDGLRSGRWSAWHEDGTPKQEIHLEEGEPEGSWIEWYSNGGIKEHGSYVRGLREGFWEFYDFEGRVDRRTGFYENGRRVN